jgi:hypothetical protein
MPYILNNQRPKIDAVIEPLLSHIQSLPMEEQDGALNYSVTKIIRHVYPKKYFHMNRALGVLSAIAHELYRHIIGPYEDEKIKENGDVT